MGIFITQIDDTYCFPYVFLEVVDVINPDNSIQKPFAEKVELRHISILGQVTSLDEYWQCRASLQGGLSDMSEVWRFLSHVHKWWTYSLVSQKDVITQKSWGYILKKIPCTDGLPLVEFWILLNSHDFQDKKNNLEVETSITHIYTVKSDTLNLVDISMSNCTSSWQLLVLLDIDISTRFKVWVFTVYIS